MPMEPTRDRLDRAEVLARISLAEVLTAELGPPRRSGGELWWPSVDPALPGTGKSPPTHIVGTDSNGIEHFKDFASGRSGTAVDVLMITRGLPFADVLRVLASQAGITTSEPLPPRRHRPVTPAPRDGGPPSPEFARWIDACAERLWLADHAEAIEARAWLHARGYTDEVLRAAQVGYDIGARRDTQWSKERRIASGIPNIGGVTFPLYDRDGTTTYAQTRNLRWTPGSRWPKYVNPGRTVTNPGIAYWTDPGPHTGRPVIIVEGPTDGLAARQAGHDVAALIGAGHAANPATARNLVAALGTDRPFVIMTDPDPAGRLAAQHLTEHLHAAGAPVIERQPEADDLAAWNQQAGPGFIDRLDQTVTEALAALTATTRSKLATPHAVTTTAAPGGLTGLEVPTGPRGDHRGQAASGRRPSATRQSVRRLTR